MTSRSPLTPEPPPQPDEGDVWAEIIAELPADDILRPLAIERRAQGIERYGVPLQRENGRDHLVDALQEALDLMAYLRAENARNCQGLARLLAIYIARDVAARRSTP